MNVTAGGVVFEDGFLFSVEDVLNAFKDIFNDHSGRAVFTLQMSFFSAAVTLMLDLEPDEDFAEVVFREELLSLEALIRDACVTPVAFAISLSCACVSVILPRSARLISAAERSGILRASCSCVISALIRASLIRVPTFLAAMVFFLAFLHRIRTSDSESDLILSVYYYI